MKPVRTLIAEKLRKCRKENGFSVETVGALLEERGIKISPKTIYSYETAKRQPA